MNLSGYLVETILVDPVTGEPVFGQQQESQEVVPEGAENLLGQGSDAAESAAGGCCGGSCCQ